MTKLLTSLTNIEKSYNKHIIAIDKFDIYTGKCIVITGDNGSGKSTFLKIINGLINADSGTIHYNGKSFAAKKNHPLASKSIYLSNNSYLFDCSVEANIAYPLLIRKKINYKQIVAQTMQWANIEHLQKRHPNSLSSGEIQRVAIARAHIINPNIWLLDEPTENLDTKAREHFYQLVNKLLADNRSVIIVTHSLEVSNNIPSTIMQLTNTTLQNV